MGNSDLIFPIGVFSEIKCFTFLAILFSRYFKSLKTELILFTEIQIFSELNLAENV